MGDDGSNCLTICCSPVGHAVVCQVERVGAKLRTEMALVCTGPRGAVKNPSRAWALDFTAANPVSLSAWLGGDRDYESVP